MPELAFKKPPVLNSREISLQRKRIIPQPSMRKLTIKIHPHIKPAHRRHWPVPMPFTRPIQARLPRVDFLPPLRRVDFPATARDEPKTKFPQHPPLAPLELIIRRMAWPRIRLMRSHIFPPCVGQIKRLAKKPIVERKCVRLIVKMSHYNPFYKSKGHHSSGFYWVFGANEMSQNESSNPLRRLPRQ